MTLTVPLLVLHCSCADSLIWLEKRLSGLGLRAVRTFDLREARAVATDCPCPHHGTTACDCQMVVLLVYGQSDRPASLILHSNDGQTWVSLVDTSAQPVDSSTRASIERALQVNSPREGL